MAFYDCDTPCEYSSKEPFVPEDDEKCLCVEGNINATLPDPINVNSMVNLDEWTDLINALLQIANASGGGGGSGEINIYKPSVDSYADLATTYPNPISGWAAQVKDTKKIYYWDGNNWEEIPYASEIKSKLAKIYPIDALPNPTLTWDGTGRFTYPDVTVSMVGYSSELIASPISIPQQNTAFRDNVYIVAVHNTTSDTWTFEYSRTIETILTNDNWYIIGRQQIIDGVRTVTIYGIGTFKENETAPSGEYIPYTIARPTTSATPIRIEKIGENTHYSITITFNSLRFSSSDGILNDTQVQSVVVSYQYNVTTSPVYYYVYTSDNGTTWSRGTTTQFNDIVDLKGYCIANVRLNAQGTQIEAELYGYGTADYIINPADGVPDFKWARFISTGIEPPVSWSTPSADARSIRIVSGTYTLITNDGTYAKNWTLTNFNTLGFIDGAYLCVSTNSISGNIQRIEDLQTIIDTPNLYVIGYFNYVGGRQNVYIEGFGNYPDTPASISAGNSNITGLPSTFSAYWTADYNFVLPAGSYDVRNLATGLSERISIAEDVSLRYNFSSVIYYPPTKDAFYTITSASVPINATVIGSMNNVGGIPTIFINGLGDFPFSVRTAKLLYSSVPTGMISYAVNTGNISIASGAASVVDQQGRPLSGNNNWTIPSQTISGSGDSYIWISAPDSGNVATVGAGNMAAVMNTPGRYIVGRVFTMRTRIYCQIYGLGLFMLYDPNGGIIRAAQLPSITDAIQGGVLPKFYLTPSGLWFINYAQDAWEKIDTGTV